MPFLIFPQSIGSDEDLFTIICLFAFVSWIFLLQLEWWRVNSIINIIILFLLYPSFISQPFQYCTCLPCFVLLFISILLTVQVQLGFFQTVKATVGRMRLFFLIHFGDGVSEQWSTHLMSCNGSRSGSNGSLVLRVLWCLGCTFLGSKTLLTVVMRYWVMLLLTPN